MGLKKISCAQLVYGHTLDQDTYNIYFLFTFNWILAYLQKLRAVYVRTVVLQLYSFMK